MGDAAHVGSFKQEVYSTPLAVKPEIEEWDTPSNYKSRHLGTDKLPDKMKVWRVQNSGQSYGGVVSRAYGFLDSPDTEVIAAGFNGGKEYGAVGIGRDGNYLQWGYSSPPSKMTQAGKNLFINCIHYIKKFNGIAPLIKRRASHRLNALRLADLINRISGDQKKFFLRTFPEELYEKYNSDPKGLVQYYRENMEWIYRDKVYQVDEELKSLGVKSNRKIESLATLIEMLNDQEKAPVARKLLERYTYQAFGSATQWSDWFNENKGRIYFTDVGGYKFMVVPKDYPIPEIYKEDLIGALDPNYGI